MKFATIIVAGLLFLGLISQAHAQVHPCSGPGPGEVVVGQTEGGNGLAPVPLCQSSDSVGGTTDTQASALHWESRWGSIATDEVHGVLGIAQNMTSKRKAERGALADCKNKGGTQCELKNTYANACGAMVMGKTGFNVGSASTKELAIQSGMKICEDSGDSDCHVYYAACSPPAVVR